MATEYIEPVPAIFEGEYKSLLSKLMANTWIAIIYVAASVIFIYVLGYVDNPIILFVAIEIPTVCVCSYVVSPNPNIFWRLQVNWVATAVLAALIYASQSAVSESAKLNIGNLAGMVAWFFVIYWTSNAVVWSMKVQSHHLAKLGPLQFIESFGKVLTIWGITLQIAYFFSWIVMPYFERITFNAPVANILKSTIESVKAISILRFLPVGALVFGLLIMVSFRFKDDPYRPKSMSEVLPLTGRPILINFLVALRLPIWILLIIIGFINHFSKLLWESIRDFIKGFLARICFIFVGLIMAPALIYFGHMIVLQSLDIVNHYLNTTSPAFIYGIKYFIFVNFLGLLSLCVYVFSIPVLAARYRGEEISGFFKSISIEIFIRGKASATAVGQSFSLFGIIPFAIPVASLLPSGQTFGIFSSLYSAAVIICFALYMWRSRSQQRSR